MPSIGGLAALRRLGRSGAPGEKCDLCAAPVAEQHAHLLEVGKRRVVCACAACALLLGSQTRARFRLIPPEVMRLNDCGLTDMHWLSLDIPINLAFLFRLSADGKMVAMYPSPAGATEAQVSMETWSQIAHHEPRLAALQDDVQALLVNRLAEPYQYFIAPIDACYRLVGIIRTHWRGFSGGAEVWNQVAAFFTELRELSAKKNGGARG